MPDWLILTLLIVGGGIVFPVVVVSMFFAFGWSHG